MARSTYTAQASWNVVSSTCRGGRAVSASHGDSGISPIGSRAPISGMTSRGGRCAAGRAASVPMARPWP
ncbi:hypothetical protein N866_00680 [Actinotalea ferrariae CF5-4]|uniref:Uncharacterized protein n=1 Tax=Actinotalea ferrariae CF5-4 TaxID=948458 RepID=A0A021VV05_9CELL|nr:hypothetical protein N866_00680 [Actinotalea ferrariae CF5-4]